MKIRLHYNKQKASSGLPWTVHTHKFCAAASSVEFQIPCHTEEHPERKSNPRYFLVAQGKVKWVGKHAVIVAE